MRVAHLIAFYSVLLLSFNCFAATRNIGDNYKLTYTIVDDSGDSVSGETVSLKIQKASTGSWYDFADSTFKASGWTSKTTTLSEDATNGLYAYTFTPPSSETDAEQYLFCIDNASLVYGDHQCETVTYQQFADSTTTTKLDTILTYTNGQKDAGVYNGIEKMIRGNR